MQSVGARLAEIAERLGEWQLVRTYSARGSAGSVASAWTNFRRPSEGSAPPPPYQRFPGPAGEWELRHVKKDEGSELWACCNVLFEDQSMRRRALLTRHNLDGTTTETWVEAKQPSKRQLERSTVDGRMYPTQAEARALEQRLGRATGHLTAADLNLWRRENGHELDESADVSQVPVEGEDA